MRSVFTSIGSRRLRAFAVAALAVAASLAGVTLGAQTPSSVANQAAAVDLEEGIRLYSAVKYQEAQTILDRVITTLAGSTAPSDVAALARAHEFRARTRFNRGDQAGAQSDFASMLRVQPDYKPDADMSPRLVPIFDGVRSRTVGDALVTLIPRGDVEIDGRVYRVSSDAFAVPLLDGEHTLRAARPGYRSAERTFTVIAGRPLDLTVTLERIYGTLTVRTIPEAVDVMLDGASKGVTPPGGNVVEGSGALLISDIAAGVHRLTFQRKCYTSLEQTVRFDELDDKELKGPVRLMPAVAKVDIRTAESGAVVYLDGQMVGSASNPLAPLCEGEHVIELRSPRGLFIDRRQWRAGDTATLTPAFRPAFAIASSVQAGGSTADEWKLVVERELAAATGALVFIPRDADLQAALRAEGVANDFVTAATPVARMKRRDVGERIAARLGAQGLASVVAEGAQGPVQVALLAAGSSEAEILRFNPFDQAGRGRAVDALSLPLPPIVRPTLDATFVDVADVQGAVVARLLTTGGAAAAGIVPGDVVTAVAGAPVASVADLKAALTRQTGDKVAVDLRAANGTTKSASVATRLVIDTIPFANGGFLYNRAVFQLQDALRQATSPLESASANLNLAIAEMRLGNWDEALKRLGQVKLAEGPGVSAGTVTYLTGLCLEAVGRHTDAVAALTRASQDAASLLSVEGPPIAPLAQSALRAAPPPR
jgi:tetratricopeptide (TPR) repeat protein